jgi:hypothetical protein
MVGSLKGVPHVTHSSSDWGFELLSRIRLSDVGFELPPSTTTPFGQNEVHSFKRDIGRP